MKLTGKCKEDFEKWFSNEYVSKPNVYNNCFDLISGENILEPFYKLPKSMQYGVYVDFFDSVDIDIDTKFCGYLKYDYSIKDKISHGLLFTEYDWSTTRQEARTKAIEKANEIYNL
jgi:hypothetical protein